SEISDLEARVEYLESIIGEMGGRGGYSAIIYKDNGIVYAKNPNGETIAQGTAGVDDASVIQSALNSLTDSRSWKEKVICIGNFILSSILTIPSYTILDVRGRFLKEGGIILSLSSVSNIEIIGGIYDVTYNSGVGGTGIYIDSSSNVYIYGTYCVIDSGSGGSDSFGVYIGHSTDVDIINCKVKANDPTRTARSKAFNPNTDTTKRVKFVNCHVEGTDRSGTGWEIDDGPSDIFLVSCSAKNVLRGIDIHTHGGGRPPAYNVMIVNFKVYNTYGDAIYIRGGEGTGEAGHDIYLENLIIDTAGGRGVWANYINNITILGALVKAPTEYGIYTANCNYKVHVEGVRVIDGGSYGIYMESGGSVVNCVVESCGGGFWGVGTTSFIGCFAMNNSGRGFYARDAPSIISCVSRDNGGDGVRLYSSSGYANVIGCWIKDNNGHGIYVYDTANHVRIIGNYIDGSGGTNILSSGSSGHNYIFLNNIGTDHGWSIPVSKASSDKVKFNQNWITENSGTATISSGTSSVTVNHGMDRTPHQVIVTGTHSEVSDCWVTDITNTQFTIHVPSAVTADREVYWMAEY
ncbi:MAG: right-handed parallel beta-helix repeat-containing protein, partial [Candidatus Hydrothermae bacterium]|nr:right-handed parallel beta-helix repeat-containing protein [Candidatus Hydrothermae bacterium]